MVVLLPAGGADCSVLEQVATAHQSEREVAPGSQTTNISSLTLQCSMPLS